MWRKWMVMFIAVVVLGLAFSPMPQAAQAQGVIWNAEYYNNGFLFEPSAVERQDAAIAFNWGTAAPWPGVNADNFTVRWGADPYFTAGTYRFWVLADDSVKLNVGFAYSPQINTFDAPKVGQIISTDITLTEGVHHVQVDYREATGDAYVYVTWANLATNPTGPNFPTFAQNVPIGGGTWTAQYYANNSLSGTPTVIASEASPSHNWGSGAASPSLPADNFSARWTSTQTIEGGSYNLTVRADDGVRVYIDGSLVLNEWHGATGQTYSSTLNLAAGARNFMIEYYEAGGNAFLEFGLARQITVGQGGGGGGQPTGSSATVTALRLNVRSAPDTNAAILLKINRNETYPIIGATADRAWYQISVGGVSGWVFGRFVSVGGAGSVPTVNPAVPTTNAPVDTGYDATAQDTVNIRSGPSRTQAILGKMPINGVARIVGRTSNNTWWQVNYQGLVGWVSSRYAVIQPGAEIGRIPVTG
ncbi:MAG: SH3 domain-containing protein [Anaerolineae bacterium]|nr:SH3 domain-containing protein [Anaerolineae bacterium]